jgi:hypothetical protein
MFVIMTRLDWFFFVTEVVSISISSFTAFMPGWASTWFGRLAYLLGWWINMLDCIPLFCS